MKRKGNENTTKQTSRRSFIGKVGGLGLGAAVLGGRVLRKKYSRRKNGQQFPPLIMFFTRATESLNLRVEEAQLAFQATEYVHPVNGDGNLYPNKIANFSKTLPHNGLGEVDLNAYRCVSYSY